MSRNFRLSHMARSMGLAITTLQNHYQRGLTTQPDSMGVKSSGEEFPLWSEGADFALDAHGATAVVPTNEIGALDAERGYCLCPGMGGHWLGLWNNVPVIGLYRDGTFDFYRASHPIRVSYLDPVRSKFPELTKDEVVSSEDGEMFLNFSQLSDADRETLREACVQRWVDEPMPGGQPDDVNEPAWMRNPTRYAYFKLDMRKPVAPNVPAPLLRGRRFTLDDVADLNLPVKYAAFEELGDQDAA